ncbi:hypothetical protein E2C01_023351 [Portunus trituberculatus]|uniref:Uncharacterized protein n=1 Tax=Portunus trituberculatus TaxID=210409 RepID=A0A5B7EA65_PORTR|nr:hypothetical protein [Portunus trituberculatus]
MPPSTPIQPSETWATRLKVSKIERYISRLLTTSITVLWSCEWCLKSEQILSLNPTFTLHQSEPQD